ncbi:MAG: MlaD protein [Verrucomicrobiota bacterium]|jgi:ABC-type transporter Mla subunit MlaD
MLAVLGVAVLWSAFAWWRAWSAPLVQVVVRPAFSVEGISSGTPVRVQGVTVGQVASIGLEPDADGRLRPLVRLSLDPATLEDRGFADRLRGDRLRAEVAQGLRARLVAVSPASGMLQVELIWDPSAPAVTEPLAADEIPLLGGSLQSRIEGFVQQLENLAEKDLVGLAADLERDLGRFHDATDPARAERFSAMLVRRTGAVLEATGDGKLDAQSARLIAACARLREAVDAADRRLDDETLALLQVRLADAGAALAAFSASLEGSQARLDGAAAEFSELFRAVSAAARTWSKKAAGLTTEPRPR